MTDVPTTALTVNDFGADPAEITTSGTPTNLPLGPRLYRVTTGGTGGNESIVLPTPDMLLDGFANDKLIGLRISVSFETRTDPSDVVVITAASGNISVTTPLGLGLPQMESVSLTYVGGAASFVWALDAWTLDAATTDSNFNNSTATGQLTTIGGQTGADGNGGGLVIEGATGTGTGNAGDISIQVGQASGSGTHGNLKIQHLPTADPHIADALWNNGGVLTVSAG